MAARSRYQLINRGRKGKPRWTVEDFDGLPANAASGRYVYSDHRRGVADGFLKNLRELERNAKKEKQNG